MISAYLIALFLMRFDNCHTKSHGERIFKVLGCADSLLESFQYSRKGKEHQGESRNDLQISRIECEIQKGISSKNERVALGGSRRKNDVHEGSIEIVPGGNRSPNDPLSVFAVLLVSQSGSLKTSCLCITPFFQRWLTRASYCKSPKPSTRSTWKLSPNQSVWML